MMMHRLHANPFQHVSIVCFVLTAACVAWGDSRAQAQATERSTSNDFLGGKVTVFIPHTDSSAHANAHAFQTKSETVLVHFHGSVEVLAENFDQCEFDCTLVVVNFNGLSSAYSKPFASDPEAFEKLLRIASQETQQLRQGKETIGWQHIYVSSFSAGYGAVRELLKNKEHLDRIDGYAAADSIYASLDETLESRKADPEQMAGFLDLAREAAEQRKHFVITHTQLETPYASTRETADYLLQALESQPAMDVRVEFGDANPSNGYASHRRIGNFRVLSDKGTDGPAHLQHLRNIHMAWAYLPIAKVSHERN